MDQFNILQWNAQSLIKNRFQFTQFLYENTIDVALICETWLKPRHNFRVKGYNIIRLDSGNDHNGVAILLHNKIGFRVINTFSDDSLQNIAVQIQYNDKLLTLVSVYCPPNSSINYNKSKLDNLIQSLPQPVFIAGDFNAHHTLWGCTELDSRGRDVLASIDDNNLVILNDGQMTTVGSHRWRQNALDLTLVSSSLALSCEWQVCDDDSLGSYHFPSNQFGFRRRKSSRESIAFLHLDIFKAMENNEILISIFFDIVGAFNNINLHVLAAELRSLAIPHLKTGHGLSIPASASIYTAECYAVLIALKYIEEHPHVSNKWLLISDSMSVLKTLKTKALDAKTPFIIYEIKSLWWKLKENNLEVKFLWTPSHIGVQGNERADNLAKSIVTADIERITDVAIPHTDLNSILKKQLKKEWKMQWNAVLEAGKGRWYASINSELSIPWFSRNKRYHSRKFYTIMCRLRFGHYRLNAHLSRMRIVASATCNFCDTEADQTAEHIIFNCPAYAIERLLLIEKLIQVYENSESVPRALQDILRNTKTYLALCNFIHNTVKEI